MCVVFFFKQKTAYEMRISDWSSDVCSSDLDIRFGTERQRQHNAFRPTLRGHLPRLCPARTLWPNHPVQRLLVWRRHDLDTGKVDYLEHLPPPPRSRAERCVRTHGDPECPERSEEHTSELQSLMRISYAVFCLKKKTKIQEPK